MGLWRGPLDLLRPRLRLRTSLWCRTVLGLLWAALRLSGSGLTLRLNRTIFGLSGANLRLGRSGFRLSGANLRLIRTRLRLAWPVLRLRGAVGLNCRAIVWMNGGLAWAGRLHGWLTGTIFRLAWSSGLNCWLTRAIDFAWASGLNRWLTRTIDGLHCGASDGCNGTR